MSAPTSLPWIKVFASLDQHPKAIRLGFRLCELDSSIKREYMTAIALGFVIKLWLWVSQRKPDGNLSSVKPHEIAFALGWMGDGDIFWKALCDSGFIDAETKTLHDWDQFQSAHCEVQNDANEKLAQKRQRDRERMAAKRAAERAAKSVATSHDAQPTPTMPTEHSTAASFNDLLVMPLDAYPHAYDAFKNMFPAFDGKNGRPTLDTKLATMREWFEKTPSKSKTWTSPRQIEKCLSDDYQKVVGNYQRDIKTGATVAAPSSTVEVPKKDKHNNAILLQHGRRWTNHDTNAWMNSRYWLQDAQAWSDTDPRINSQNISTSQIDAAKRAALGTSKQSRPIVLAAEAANDALPTQSTMDATTDNLVKRSQEHLQSWGKDINSEVPTVDQHGAKIALPTGYVWTLYDRKCYDKKYTWTARGWEPSSSEISANQTRINKNTNSVVTMTQVSAL